MAVAVFAAFVLLGTVGYWFIQPRYTWLESLYMTVITVTTAGHCEVGGPLGPPGRLWTIFVLASGLTSGAVVLSLIVAAAAEGRIRRILGRRHLERRIAALSGHVIVCGFGRMGSQLVQQLTDGGREVVVVDVDPQRTALAEQAGFLYVLGDAQEEETLAAAGLDRAGDLVAVLKDDAANTFLTLSARQMSQSIRIVARAQETTTQDKLLKAGASRVVCPQVIGANRIADVLLRPAMVDFVEMAHQGVDLEMDQWTVKDSSPLAGRTLRELKLPARLEAMVVAVRRPDGTAVYNPGADTVLSTGDTIVLIGRRGAVATISRLAE